jgi:hypothetical protein
MRAWREFAADVSFSGMTLEEFEEGTAKVVTVREEIEKVRVYLAGLLGQRAMADEDLRKKLMLVTNATRGDPAYGEDSPLYRAMGYVPRSERNSGLTRKGGRASGTRVRASDANAA